jgi:hypothetical protein
MNGSQTTNDPLYVPLTRASNAPHAIPASLGRSTAVIVLDAFISGTATWASADYAERNGAVSAWFKLADELLPDIFCNIGGVENTLRLSVDISTSACSAQIGALCGRLTAPAAALRELRCQGRQLHSLLREPDPSMHKTG